VSSRSSLSRRAGPGPVSPYGVSKLAGERYLHYYSVQYGISAGWLCLTRTFRVATGPHGEPGFATIFCGNLAVTRTSTINGTGEPTRDQAYVDDVARAKTLALENEGSPEPTTSVQASRRALTRSTTCCRPSPARSYRPQYGSGIPGEQMRSPVDPTLASRVLVCVPRWTLPRA
jgi:UDP-glucose 4-epimerase